MRPKSNSNAEIRPIHSYPLIKGEHHTAIAPARLMPSNREARCRCPNVGAQLATGRRFRVLSIVDDVTRECLRAVVDTSISGRWVVRELADVIAERGACLPSDCSIFCVTPQLAF